MVDLTGGGLMRAVEELGAELRATRHAQDALGPPDGNAQAGFAINTFMSVVPADSTEIGVAGPISVPFAVIHVAMLSAEIRGATCDFLRPAIRISVAGDGNTDVMSGYEIFGQYRASPDDNVFLSPGMVFAAPMHVPILLREQYIKTRVQNFQTDDCAVSVLVSVELHPEWDG